MTKASGSYVSKLPTQAIYILYNYADQGIKLTHQWIKATIKPLWSQHKLIGRKDTFSVWVKVLRYKQFYNNTDKEYKYFKEIMNDSDLLMGIDN